MTQFNFTTFLNEEEFEKLGCDIVQQREHISLESFSNRKDGGIDFRYIQDNSNYKLVVQCKCYSNYDDLIYQLKNTELKKVKRLKPERYILVVATVLTVKQKQEIFNLFKDYIHNMKDIIIPKDIENLFRNQEYTNIANHYLNLGIQKFKSLSFFQNISNTIKIDSCLSENIKEVNSYFVETSAYEKALDSLQKNKIIFLTGDPGAGKTVNAKMLINHLIFHRQIDEVYQIFNCEQFYHYYQSDKKQVFFFDDFWGSTFEAQKLSLNEEKKLLDIISRVERSKSTYFILTTREYVLEQGLAFYHEFQTKYLDKRTFFQNCCYTTFEKIQMLLSHACLSNLDFDIIHHFIYSAERIVNKPNYSPRLIDYFIHYYEDRSLSTENFFDEFYCFLDNPNKYFRGIFYSLSEGAQILAFILSISSPAILVDKLKLSFKSFLSVEKQMNIKVSEFKNYIQELENTFVITTYQDDDFIINFKNPSIHDFILEELNKKILDYENLFVYGVLYFEQFIFLLNKEYLSLSSQYYELLCQRFFETFYSLEICDYYHDDLFIYDDEIEEPDTYLSEKIWQVFRIISQDKMDLFRPFIQSTIENLLNSYQNVIHFYEDDNFTNIPELIKKAIKIGCHFPKEVVVPYYLNNYCYLYELHALTYFPEEYQTYAKELMNIKKDDFLDNLPDILEEELDYFSEGGITLQYDLTIDSLKEILEFFNFEIPAKVQEILEENKQTLKVTHHFASDEENLELIEKRRSEQIENEKINTFLNNTKKEIFGSMDDEFFLSMLDESNFSQKKKELIIRALCLESSIFSLLYSSSKEYIQLVFQYTKKTSIQNLSFLPKDFFPNFMDIVLKKFKNTNIISVLEKYAFDTSNDNLSYLSKKHFLDSYPIKEEEVDELVKLGILRLGYQLVMFSDSILELYFVANYMNKQKNKSYEFYENYFKLKSIFSNWDFKMLEMFDCDFKSKFLKSVFYKILNEDDAFDQFINNVTDITIEFNENYQADGLSYAWKELYFFFNHFMYEYFDKDILNDLEEIVSDKEFLKRYATKEQEFYLKEFMNNPKNYSCDKYKEILSVCQEYWDIIHYVYQYLSSLEDNENIDLNHIMDYRVNEKILI